MRIVADRALDDAALKDQLESKVVSPHARREATGILIAPRGLGVTRARIVPLTSP